MPSGKMERSGMLGISALAAAQPEEIRTRRTNAEQTYSNILGRLGAQGTYDLPGQASQPTAAATPGDGTDTAGIFKTEKAKGAQARALDYRYSTEKDIADITSLDPEKATKAIENSAQFRIMSRLTAESEQTLAREGPLYNEMIKNQQLPIIEGSAAIARDNAEQVKRAFARGGAARRQAFETVQKIRAQERINSQKIQQLSQVRTNLDNWARENARTNLQFAQSWASNLGGIRESYNQAMDQASELMVNGALPIMMQATERANQYRAQAHAQNRAKLGRLVSGILGVGSLFMGGMGAMGIGPSVFGTNQKSLIGYGLNTISQAIPGMESPIFPGMGSPNQGNKQ